MRESRKIINRVLCLIFCLHFIAGYSTAGDADELLPPSFEGETERVAAAEQNESLSSVGADLTGIWSINLNDTDQLTMVLYQLGGRLFGSCKYEGPDPWNAVAMGSISKDKLDVIITYLRKGAPVTLTLMGNYSQEYIQGSFFKQDSTGSFDSGAFTCMLIHPDPTSYVPVKVEDQPVALPQPVTVETTPQPAQDKSRADSRYTDVHDLAHLVPPAAGVIPPAMGISGAGGSSMR